LKLEPTRPLRLRGLGRDVFGAERARFTYLDLVIVLLQRLVGGQAHLRTGAGYKGSVLVGLRLQPARSMKDADQDNLFLVHAIKNEVPKWPSAD